MTMIQTSTFHAPYLGCSHIQRLPDIGIQQGYELIGSWTEMHVYHDNLLKEKTKLQKQVCLFANLSRGFPLQLLGRRPLPVKDKKYLQGGSY